MSKTFDEWWDATYKNLFSQEIIVATFREVAKAAWDAALSAASTADPRKELQPLFSLIGKQFTKAELSYGDELCLLFEEYELLSRNSYWALIKDNCEVSLPIDNVPKATVTQVELKSNTLTLYMDSGYKWLISWHHLEEARCEAWELYLPDHKMLTYYSNGDCRTGSSLDLIPA